MKLKDATLREFLQAILEMKLHLIMELPTGYNYHGSEDYVLDRGREFKSQPLTDLEHKQLFFAIDNYKKRFQIKQCFSNCQLLLFYDISESLHYYEGYACGPAGMPVHHAWLSIGSGKVVDLTWRCEDFKRKGRLSNRIIGEIPEGWHYFGVEFPRRYVIDHVLDTEMASSLLEDWPGGYPLFKHERIHPVEDLLE